MLAVAGWDLCCGGLSSSVPFPKSSTRLPGCFLHPTVVQVAEVVVVVAVVVVALVVQPVVGQVARLDQVVLAAVCHQAELELEGVLLVWIFFLLMTNPS